ncbi:MAG: hypothetical protein KA746_17385 [Pyrinomonadaceae bacterium]|nr:hypothetical protein [Pyrinomonadaceae bacterium]MBP6212171.1 hypothetical protein [Pyrinomonadaceae bacterium]
MKNPEALFIGKLNLLVLLWLIFPIAVTAQSSVLPPAAQEAVNKGVIAAKVPDYLLAIRYFEEARKIAPDAPIIYLNLGLAESKIPGRELRAIAWFGAYLTANPTAQNAAAVREQITVLDVKNQSNVSRLIMLAQEAAKQLPYRDLGEIARLWWKTGDNAAALKMIVSDQNHISLDRKSLLNDIVVSQVELRDITAAQKTADLIEYDKYYMSRARLAIAEAQVDAGDFAGAQRNIDLIQQAEIKSSALKDFAEGQIRTGDIAGGQRTLAIALKTAGLIENPFDKTPALADLALAQAKSGDIVGARATFVEAQKTAELIKEAPHKAWRQFEIADAQIRAGDKVAATETLASSLKTTDLVSDKQWKLILLRDIAEVQAKSGDFAGALKIADLLLQDAPYYRVIALTNIGKIQATSGDTLGAQNTFAEARKSVNFPRGTPKSKRDTLRLIAKAETNNSITVSDWLDLLDDDDTTNYCPLNTGPFRDLTGYLKSLPTSSDPKSVFESQLHTAEKLVKAQIVVQQLLKQQAPKQ